MASSRILQFAKRAVEVGYIKPTLGIAPYVGGFFGLGCIKNGYDYSRNKERCIPRALVHGVMNGVTGGLFAYGMTWVVVPAMIGGFTMWAIGDREQQLPEIELDPTQALDNLRCEIADALMAHETDSDVRTKIPLWITWEMLRKWVEEYDMKRIQEADQLAATPNHLKRMRSPSRELEE